MIERSGMEDNNAMGWRATGSPRCPFRTSLYITDHFPLRSGIPESSTYLRFLNFIYISPHIMSLSAWEVEANKCREILVKSIPEQFKVPEDALPGAEELHAANFCKTSGRIKNITPEDALLVPLLKKAGAVFHVRTNQPQSLMVRC
jgi:hypothetical protein